MADKLANQLTELFKNKDVSINRSIKKTELIISGLALTRYPRKKLKKQ